MSQYFRCICLCGFLRFILIPSPLEFLTLVNRVTSHRINNVDWTGETLKMHCLNFRSVFAGPLFISLFVFHVQPCSFYSASPVKVWTGWEMWEIQKSQTVPTHDPIVLARWGNWFTKAWCNQLQELIDAAAYVPPPPSQEKLKRINRL